MSVFTPSCTGDRSGYDRAYRRGVHQALEFAADILDQAETIRDGRRRLILAVEIARRLREDSGQPHPALLDEIRSRLHGAIARTEPRKARRRAEQHVTV